VSGFGASTGIQGKMEATLSPSQAQIGAVTAEELCRMYAPSVCRFAAMTARSPADADDLAQDALLRAVRSLHSFDPARGSLESWLWRIVANAAKDSARRRRRALEVITSISFATAPEAESVEDAVLERLRDADLHDRLRLMRHRDRTLLALRYGVGLDTDEVGAAVGLNSDSAGKAIRRALRRLRALLEETRT
jgi:RNA polymerase sigma-70 factor (ECF subfamily)